MKPKQLLQKNYINDAGGNPLAIYEYDEAAGLPAFALVEQPLYGSGRIGTVDKVTGVINYEITDHLGNVRATIKGISTGVYQLTSRTDYYAFGGTMPGRSCNLNTLLMILTLSKVIPLNYNSLKIIV